MSVGWMVAAVQASERQLAHELRAVAERRRAEAEVFHVGRRLAQLADRNAERLQPWAERLRAPHRVLAPPADPGPDVFDEGVGLLRDLRHLHVLASGVVLDWTALEQGAAAARQDGLEALVSACQQEPARTAAWTRTLLKTGAPQALTSTVQMG